MFTNEIATVSKTETRGARIRGALRLASQVFDQGTARVHEFHRAISDIPTQHVPALLGVTAAAKPVQSTHDAITDGVYLGIRAVGSATFAGVAALLKVSEDKLPQAQALAEAARPMSAIQAEAIGAISGLIGDDLAKQRNPIVPRLGFYRDGQRLRMTADALSAAFPEATGRIAIFLHGLCGSEHTWSYFQTPGDAETLPYSERLHTDLGFTPVMLRYNSGLNISLNGRSLARAMEKLLQAWPVPVQDIVLIGHSMGGLLARSATYAASKSQLAWTKKLRHIVCLGSPHTGAPLERVVNQGVAWMHKLPLSRPLAKVLDVRSVGIRDLSHGFVIDEDHKGRSRVSLNADSRTPIAPLATAQYHFIGTTLGSGPDSYWSETIGDGLVHLSSSTAAHVANADAATLYSSNHMRLLNHPAVYQQLLQRLGAPMQALPAV